VGESNNQIETSCIHTLSTKWLQ